MGAAPAAAMVAVAGSSSALKELENARRSPPRGFCRWQVANKMKEYVRNRKAANPRPQGRSHGRTAEEEKSAVGPIVSGGQNE